MMLTLAINAVACLVVSDLVGQRHINLVTGLFVLMVLVLNCVVMYRRVFK